MKLAHIINPVKVADTSRLYVAQPVTFESMKVAQAFAAGKVDAELYSVSYPEDHEIIPAYFKKLPNLERSVLDLGSFTKQKKYPVLIDVLKSLYNASDAEYLVYTNVDISLKPQFYLAVSELLKEGYDALLINRRGIPTNYKHVDELPMMYAEHGKPHPGFDCFVFKRSLLNKLILENICLGVSFSEVALLHNFIAFAENLKLVDDLHLTFHIGTEVMPPLDPEYYWYNRNEYEKKIYPQLKPYLNISKFPYSELPLHKRMIKWALNPSFRTQQVAELEGMGFLRRLKYRIDEVRFSLLENIK
jgi:hypothetical protein